MLFRTTWLAAALPQAQGALPRGGLELAADISMIVLAVGSAVLLLVMAVLLLQVRKLLSAMRKQLNPVADRARVAAENVEYISAVVRTDIQKVNDSVTSITDRLNQASDHMEERIAEFNALMQVVQGEAEDMFLDTAAAARGVRAGARTLSVGAPSPLEEEGDDDADRTDDEASDDDRLEPTPASEADQA